jgi:pullulanase/glycogen debranching enzyme
MRAPMRWDLVTGDNVALNWTKQLIALRRQHRALRVGDYRAIEAQRLYAFERRTDFVAETVLVVVNSEDVEVTETLLVADSKLMDSTRMVDLIGNAGVSPIHLWAALMQVTVPPKTALVLRPDVAPPGGYSNYKRVQ